MKYPITIDKKLQEVKEIIERWPVEVHFQDVLKWIMQFDTVDFEIPIRILKNLNVIGFEDLNSALSVAYSKLKRMAIDKETRITTKNTLFAGIGEGGKSGAMISYNFRLINELSEENFLDDTSIKHIEQGRIENIVLVDDIVSTGNQATSEINNLAERVIPLGVKNIFLLTAVGMKKGIKKVEDETSAFVFSAFEYDMHDTVQSLDSSFYEGIPYERRSIMKERLGYYGRIVSKSPLGYGSLGGLIIFYYNTPNSTLPIVWSSMNSWIPLFKRVRKINGIESYYKQFDNIKPKKKAKNEIKELVLFVEGKTEELFFEILLDRIKKKLGIEKVDVISLGGGYMSEKLIDNLQKFSKAEYIFIIENNPYVSESYISKRLKNIKYLKGKPHIMSNIIPYYLDMKSIASDEEFSRFFEKIESIEGVDEQVIILEFERQFLRRFPLIRRDIYLKRLLEKYPYVERLNELIGLIEVKFEELKGNAQQGN